MNKALQPPTRERRLGGVSAYLGDVAALIAELEAGPPVPRIRTFSQVAVDDVSAALRVLAEVDGLGVVVHGVRGCAGALARGAAGRPWAVTNLDQRDTILGADGVLARTQRRLYERYRPWAIVVVATPVVAINNDDIQSVAAELGDELGIPVIELRTDGFRSRIAATGYDIASGALAALIQPRHGRRRNLINLLAFERGPGLAAIARQIAALGLEVNVLPAGAGPDAFAKAAQAVLSVAVFQDEADVLRRELDRLHRVPFLHLPPPIGAAGARHFIEAVAEATERPLPATEEGGHQSELLGDRRVVVALPPSQALAVAGLVGQLGGRVAGLSVDWIDSLHLEGLKALSAASTLALHIGAGQPFELVNWLGKLKPDLLIGTPAAAATATRAGIAAVAVEGDDLLGVAGEVRLATRIVRALDAQRRGDSFEVTIAYLPGWLKRSPDWHIKREVR
ncbi:nitrogenase component 1 [Rhodopseudomonas telluris]|uniref:Nitrogenase component 1 n=1 Tax=Rhodopseudomonas telluris TaxID=644215 RepID=A0ABV6EZY7_9BRAD